MSTWPSVIDCPDCQGDGHSYGMGDCIWCGGTGVICAECLMTPNDCHCEETQEK